MRSPGLPAVECAIQEVAPCNTAESTHGPPVPDISPGSIRLRDVKPAADTLDYSLGIPLFVKLLVNLLPGWTRNPRAMPQPLMGLVRIS
jgi:hypothetical protein